MALDTEKLLRPIAEGMPCGEELRYDPAFQSLLDEIEPKVEYELVDGREMPKERPREWPRLHREALRLAEQGRDLRLLVLLSRTALGQEGLDGFADSLGVLRSSLADYWDTLHPLLDTDETDPAEQAMLRLNALRQLADAQAIVAELRAAPIVSSRALGSVDLRMIEMAEGRLRPGPGERAVDASLIEAIFKSADDGAVAAAAETTGRALEEISAIETVLGEKIGRADMAPDLAPLAQTLRSIRGHLEKRTTATADSGGGATATAGNEGGHAAGTAGNGATPAAADIAGAGRPAAAPAQAPRAAAPGSIETREDVVAALDRILDYYRRNEPSSPIPLLIERVKKLVPMSFLELIEDLAPSGVKELKSVAGMEKK